MPFTGQWLHFKSTYTSRMRAPMIARPRRPSQDIVRRADVEWRVQSNHARVRPRRDRFGDPSKRLSNTTVITKSLIPGAVSEMRIAVQQSATWTRVPETATAQVQSAVSTLPPDHSTVLAEIILSRTFRVIRWMRGSVCRKYLLGGFMKPGGVDSTIFHQHVPALKTKLPFFHG
jgi:hypothetical protein